MKTVTLNITTLAEAAIHRVIVKSEIEQVLVAHPDVDVLVITFDRKPRVDDTWFGG